jgi:hypothetical protein
MRFIKKQLENTELFNDMLFKDISGLGFYYEEILKKSRLHYALREQVKTVMDVYELSELNSEIQHMCDSFLLKALDLQEWIYCKELESRIRFVDGIKMGLRESQLPIALYSPELKEQMQLKKESS